mmetsp:Transcript_17343/g.42850  ORF Transcript_17343/g.42850 Transcript_17343/m.42850 type:complete len:90 (-) Transcript_17343:3792-4061(-)
MSRNGQSELIVFFKSSHQNMQTGSSLVFFFVAVSAARTFFFGHSDPRKWGLIRWNAVTVCPLITRLAAPPHCPSTHGTRAALFNLSVVC